MPRRFSGAEFAASIRSLFNDTAAAAPIATVFSDPVILGFQVDASALLVQELNASQLMDNAEAVAAWAASSMTRLTAFGSCSTKDTTCGQKFVKAFGLKAFRTKLADSDARVARYLALFNAETTYTAGAQTVITRDAAVAALSLPQRAGHRQRQHVHADAVRGGDQPRLPADGQHARRHAAGGRRSGRRRHADDGRDARSAGAAPAGHRRHAQPVRDHRRS